MLISDLVVGDEFEATVADTSGAQSLWMDLRVVSPGKRGSWRRVRGRLRYETASTRRKKDGKPATKTVIPREKEGDQIKVRIKSVQPSSARFEVERVVPTVPSESCGHGATPGRRALPKREVAPGEGRLLLEELEIGQELRGVVVRVMPAGVLLDCKVARRGRGGKLIEADGLLQRARFPENWASTADVLLRDDVERRLGVGDELTVYVRSALPENGFLWLSVIPVDKDELAAEGRAWEVRNRRRRRRPGAETLAVGDERRGTVREQAKFGAFVDIGLSTDGLIHYTTMGAKYRVGWEETVTVGAEVLVLVRDVSGNRISLELLALGEDIEELKVAREVEDVIDESDAFARPAARAVATPAALVSADAAGDANDADDIDEDDPKENQDNGDFDIDDDYLEDKYGDF